MLNNSPDRQTRPAQAGLGAGPMPRRLWLAIWAGWTLAVIGAGYFGWRADILAGRPDNLIGMAVDAATVGIVGLVVLTVIEIRYKAARARE